MGKWYQLNGSLNKAINMYIRTIMIKSDYATAFNNRSSAYSSINLLKAIALILRRLFGYGLSMLFITVITDRSIRRWLRMKKPLRIFRRQYALSRF